MVKRIDLVKPTRLLKTHKKLIFVTQLLQELYKDVQLEPFFLSLEITLNIYNLLINSIIHPNDLYSLRHKIPQVISSLYDHRTLTTEQWNKVSKDVDYIHQQHLFTRVSTLQVWGHNIWIFFLQVGN